MFKRGIFNKKSISFSWFVSYILIIAIATCVNMYTYKVAKNKVFEQINAINSESLERSRIQLDNLQKSIGNLASELSFDETIHRLMEKEAVDSEFLFDVIKVKDEIGAWENLENEVERVFVYFKNTDYIADRSVAHTSEFFHKLHYNNKSINKDEFRVLLQTAKNGRYIRISDEGESETSGNIIFLFSVYSEDLLAPKATIAVEVKGDTLLLNQGENSHMGSFCILDESNKLLLSNADEPTLQNRIDEKIALSEKKGVYVSEDEVLLYTPSKQNDWKYLCVIDEGEYLSELFGIRLLTYLLIALYVIVGISLAIYMTHKNRKPILQIVEQLSNYRKELSQRSDGNELQYINQCIVDMLKKREEQNSKMKIQRNLVKDAVLNEVLQNEEVPEVSLKELLSSVDVSLWEKYFAVVMFNIDSSELFFENGKDKKENKKLSQMIISNVLSEILDSELTPVCCNIKDNFVCIVNGNRQDITGNIKNALEETISFIRTNFNLKVVAGLSSVHEDYYGLRQCYSEALKCMEYKLFVEYDIIEYNIIKENTSDFYYFPIEKEIQMIGALKSGDYEGGVEILNQIFDENTEKTTPQSQMLKCLVYDILGSIMKVLGDLGEVDGEKIFNRFSAFERIDNCKSVNEIKSVLLEIFKDICEKALEKSIEKTSNNIEEIKEFIDNNYHNPNLSGSMVAGHFGINQSYLSAVFKKYTGEGLLEYTMKIRMEKALKLLAETEDTVEVISEKVGYMSVKTFRRTFKKIYGFTPSMYRDAVEKDL